MKTDLLPKMLYISSGKEEIITSFVDKRFSTTAKDGNRKYTSKKKNKRITEAKVYGLIHKFWVEKIHKNNLVVTINRNKLADDIWSEKRYETSMILRFMEEDGLITKVKDPVHTEGYGESSGYQLGLVLNTNYYSIKSFPADCAVIKNMIEHSELFAQHQQEVVYNESLSMSGDHRDKLTKANSFWKLNLLTEDLEFVGLNKDEVNKIIVDKILNHPKTKEYADQLLEHLDDYIEKNYPAVNKNAIVKEMIFKNNTYTEIIPVSEECVPKKTTEDEGISPEDQLKIDRWVAFAIEKPHWPNPYKRAYVKDRIKELAKKEGFLSEPRYDKMIEVAGNAYYIKNAG